MPNAQGKLLIEMIKGNIQIMDYAIDRQLWRDAAFYVQQVIEKSLKLVLMSQGVPDNQLYTHDIYRLILMLNQFGITVPGDIIAAANNITIWEAKSRYDSTFSGKPLDIKKCAKIAKAYFKLVTKGV
jgi:HEPN domain-containing protein